MRQTFDEQFLPKVLQLGTGVKTADGTQFSFIAYDLVFCAQNLCSTPWLNRRRQLETTFKPNKRCRLSYLRTANTVGEIAKEAKQIRDTGDEGLVIKRGDSHYTPNARTAANVPRLPN